MTHKPLPGDGGTQAILRHWREAVPNDRLAHIVRDAAKGLTRALQGRLAEEGVSFGHWVFLRILWEADGLTQSELSAEAGVMEPTTFAALKAMEKLGYIKRRKTPENRKKVFIHLTPEGRAMKSRLVPLAVDVNRIAVNGAGAADLAATRALLLRMIENLAADESNRMTANRPNSRKPPRRRQT
jgi:DNA-binding MarR family transcriptional regulator